MVDLETTNWLIGVMAVASVLQTLMFIGLAVAGFSLYRQLTGTLTDLEARHVVPLRRQIDGVLTDVQAITARVSQQTERVDHAISGTIERVDETADRIKDTVRDRVSQVTGVVRGIRAVVASVLQSDGAPKRPAPGPAPTGMPPSGVMDEAPSRL